MARLKGVSTLAPLTLNQLVAAMGKYPEVPIQVGKGCIAALEKALNVDFGLAKDETATVSTDSAPDVSAPKSVAQVD